MSPGIPDVPDVLTPWQQTIARAEKRITSQSHQDGVLEAIFYTLGTTNRFFCEFGFNTNGWTGGSGANTYQLHARGWSGLLMDGGHENASINLRREWSGPHGIVGLLAKPKAPKEMDYMSIDFDSYDLWTFRSIVVGSSYRPRVISVEYNPLFPFDSTLTLRYPVKDGYWDRFHNGAKAIFGTSLGALDLVAREGGYTLVYAVSGLDAFFVRSDVLTARGITVAPLSALRPVEDRLVDGPCLSQPSNLSHWPVRRVSLGGHYIRNTLAVRCKMLPKDTSKLAALEDYAVYKRTGSHDLARRAAARSELVKYLLHGRAIAPAGDSELRGEGSWWSRATQTFARAAARITRTQLSALEVTP